MDVQERGADEQSHPGRTGPGKGLQPRIVLGLLAVASFVGVWVSHFGRPLGARALTWALLASMGLLAGGCYWRVAPYDAVAFADPADAASVADRWYRVETVAVWAFAVAGVAYFGRRGAGMSMGIGTLGIGLGVVAAPILWLAGRRSRTGSSASRESPLRSALLLVAVLSLGGFAWVETGTTPVDWLVRAVHVGAFSLWLGGAVWHNVVVLPTIRSRPTAADALKSQARGFRRHLAGVIPFLFATGVYQTSRLVGLSAPAILESRIGTLIAVKIGVLLALTALVLAALRRSA
ncbi:hypothetical protein [Halosimplex sp. J119]